MEVYLKARSLAGDSTDRVQALRNAYMASGLPGYWRKRVEHLTAAGEDLPLVGFARLYAGLGEDDQALTWLKEVA